MACTAFLDFLLANKSSFAPLTISIEGDFLVTLFMVKSKVSPLSKGPIIKFLSLNLVIWKKPSDSIGLVRATACEKGIESFAAPI